MAVPIPTIVSLTALPARFSTLETVLRSLADQTVDDYEIHLNLPEYCKLESTPVDAPEFLATIPRLRVFRTEDVGSHTKLLPTLQRLTGDAMIITVDDDITYHPEMVAEHRRQAVLFPGCAVGYAGRHLMDPSLDPDGNTITENSGGHFYGPVRRPVAVKILEGYKSVAYRPDFFSDIYELYAERFWEDDVVISSMLGAVGIERMAVAHPDETDFRSRAESFPVQQIAGHPGTGCAARRDPTSDSAAQDATGFFGAKGWLD